MFTIKFLKPAIIASLLAVGAITLPQSAAAHCDSMDGPVVIAAKEALQTGELHHVLIWVNDEQEEEIREAFQDTREVRQESSNARELADRYFFETVVRLHRESEGAPYTGLKPADRDVAPFVPKVDEAVDTGSPEELRDLLMSMLEQGLHAQLDPVIQARDFDSQDVEAGREYVHHYVEFLHYVKPIFEAITAESGGHAFSQNH